MIAETATSEALGMIRRFQASAPVDIMGIANSLGLKVYESATHLPAGVSGMILQDREAGGSTGYCIIVRSSEPFVRKRFTVAHEIAHFMLHRSQIGHSLSDDTLYRSSLTSVEESQANRLAAEILMPLSLIRTYTTKIGVVDPAILARTFQVSELAMKIRLGLA